MLSSATADLMTAVAPSQPSVSSRLGQVAVRSESSVIGSRARRLLTGHHGVVDPSRTQHILTLLEERRQRALERWDALTGDFDDIVERSSDASRDDEHDPEGATIAFDRAQVSSLVSAAEQELADIDRAIERVRSGLHDRCETCGDEIPMERLRARPATRTCIGCARAVTAEG